MTELQKLLKDLVAQIITEDQANNQNSRQNPEPSRTAPDLAANKPQVIGGLLSERMIKQIANAGQKVVYVNQKAVVTPLAREAAQFLGVTLKKIDGR